MRENSIRVQITKDDQSIIFFVEAIYPEKHFSGTPCKDPIFHLCLRRQVIDAAYGSCHAFDGEKSGHIRCVRRYQDQSEEPPHSTDDASRVRPETKKSLHCSRYSRVND